MGPQWTTGCVLTSLAMFKMVSHMNFVGSLPKCAWLQAWYECMWCFSLSMPHFFKIHISYFCWIACLQAFNSSPVLPPVTFRPDQLEEALKSRYHDAMSRIQGGKELDLLIVILPDNNGSLYGNRHLPECILFDVIFDWIVLMCSVVYFYIMLKVSCLGWLGDLKRICETDLGIVSQCCLTKHVFKKNKQYMANVALKINVKVCQLCPGFMVFLLVERTR